MPKLTEAHFSMLCSYIAKNAAAWAGDILTLPERHARPADPANVARFTDEIRGKLDRLDEMASRTAEDPDGAAPASADTPRAGRRFTMTLNLTDEERAELERLARTAPPGVITPAPLGSDAIIISLPSHAVPEGWQLVPKEPTHEMLRAMFEAMFDAFFDGTSAPMIGAGYDAALAFAPKHGEAE
ncbi:MAG: hypothetical protein PGN22_15795 [Agrobacterium cavarae]